MRFQAWINHARGGALRLTFSARSAPRSDFGFDPARFGSTPANLARFREVGPRDYLFSSSAARFPLVLFCGCEGSVRLQVHGDPILASRSLSPGVESIRCLVSSYLTDIL